MSSSHQRNEIMARLGIEQLPVLIAADPDDENTWEQLQQPAPMTQMMTVPGRKCPNCLAKGQTVWVIPGKCCPECGVPVND
ncbi:hypothetical protein M501DRAFT_1060835 [Patellaria atrata CBS 101060]|uniref:Uncharacterized protein n=1 Tax=Patellaria atrata CBS 101060 TaxID=1346257 RepID=A0A9P4VPJ6_9PEZI|nr:hypothetical protein M501DRAFT_1060835 [Patellaria atrata CBS 101060]